MWILIMGFWLQPKNSQKILIKIIVCFTKWWITIIKELSVVINNVQNLNLGYCGIIENEKDHNEKK